MKKTTLDAKVTFRLTTEEKERFRNMAEKNGLTMTQFITHCLEHWYEVSWNDICPVLDEEGGRSC